MDVAEYRKRTEAALEAARVERAERVDEATPAEALGRLLDGATPVGERLAALQIVGRAAAEDPTVIDRLVDVLADTAALPELREGAVEVLQGLAFLVTVFAPYRPRYHEVLRAMVDDPNPILRRRALAILARYKDEYAQRRLTEGLEHPTKALLPAAKAIQYLGYDIHAEYFPLLRRIVEKPPTVSAKREAIRLLAADPSSKTLLSRVLNDKSEPSRVRQMSALALQSLAPTSFERAARQISLDDTEDDRLRATTIGALARYGTPEPVSRRSTFSRRISEIQTTASSPQLRRASKSYVDRRSG